MIHVTGQGEEKKANFSLDLDDKEEHKDQPLILNKMDRDLSQQHSLLLLKQNKMTRNYVQ